MSTRHRCVALPLVTACLLSVASHALLAGPGSQDIQNLFDGDRAFGHIEALVSLGTRVAAGPTEKVAAAYIAAEMESYGLEVEIQEFPLMFFEDYGSRLEVVDGPELAPLTMLYSPPGMVVAEIVESGLGYPEDFPPEVSGKIALIERGLIPFSEKIANAAAAGAIAGIVYNNVPGNMNATLGSPSDIPAVMISQEDGEVLLALLAEGAVAVALEVDVEMHPSTSQNVIGTLAGTQPEQGTVYIGAHYDSLWHGPGANDDASGVGGVLEAARVLATKGHRTKATMKFIAFGAEEVGLQGSAAYVFGNEEEVVTQGLGMINLDQIAVGDTLFIGNIGWGGPTLLEHAQAKADAMGVGPWEPWVAGTNSDHAYFEWVGVPAVFLFQTPDPYYHTAEDTLDKIDVAKLEENGELAAAVLYEWAKNPALREKKAGD